MVSGVVPAPLSAHPLVIWDAPLFGRLMSSSNHVARHTKHIVIREISQDSKHPKNPPAKIRTGSNANNIYSIIASWNFERALAVNSEKSINFAGRIDRMDWMGLITAASLISIRHRGPKKVGSQRKAFYGFALSIRVLLMTYTTDCTSNGCGDGSVSREPSGYTSFLVLLTYFIAISFHRKRSEIAHGRKNVRQFLAEMYLPASSFSLSKT